jgi:hypothetical protein
MSKRYSKIGQNIIEWDETYFIAYAGGKRDLPEKDLKEYNKAANGGLPDLLRAKEILKLGFEKNPNVVPIRGLALLEIIKERQFIPFFDPAFKVTKLLQVNDKIVYESIKQKSYEIAMGI